jgi:twitching motility two-component system response regulator PilG
MNMHRSIWVAHIGLPAHEQRRVQRAFVHMRHRTPNYRLSPLTEDASVQILLLNADDLAAEKKYQQACELNPAMAEIPVVRVSRRRETQARESNYIIKRPMIATRFIGVLDQVAMKELNIKQPLAIEEDTTQLVTVILNEDKTTSVAPGNPTTGAYRALVVDDSLPVRIQMHHVLQPFTSQVDFAETGEEALELISKNQYDIIFLDVVLPGIDGYEICKQIKDGPARDTPVIMLTGNSSPADRIKGKLVGCDTYLIKPVGKEIFQQVVEQYLHKSSVVQILVNHTK